MASSDTTKDHISKSDHDFEVANALSTNACYCDWRFVCIFYSVIHRIDAYAHKTHREKELMPSPLSNEGWYDLRRKFVRNYLNKYYGLYDRLYNQSRNCRYNPKHYQQLVQNSSFWTNYLNKLLEEFEKFKITTQ